MRSRPIALIVMLALPALAGAQLRVPIVGRRPSPVPAPLPPEAPTVARATALKRSRWSAEGYGMVTQIRVPTGTGGLSSYSTLGAGTHADYRVNEHLAATVDLTASYVNSPATTATAEVGGRFLPLKREDPIRPFVDLRGGYMYMYDNYISGLPPVAATSSQALESTGRYSRGFGGVTGIGSEFSLTNSLSLTTEVSAFRDHLNTYRLTGGGGLPNESSYWLTALRYSVGLRFNPVRTLK